MSAPPRGAETPIRPSGESPPHQETQAICRMKLCIAVFRRTTKRGAFHCACPRFWSLGLFRGVQGPNRCEIGASLCGHSTVVGRAGMERRGGSRYGTHGRSRPRKLEMSGKQDPPPNREHVRECLALSKKGELACSRHVLPPLRRANTHLGANFALLGVLPNPESSDPPVPSRRAQPPVPDFPHFSIAPFRESKYRAR